LVYWSGRVNSTTLLIVIILLGAKDEMTIHERKLMVFRLLDCENNGQISGEGMVCCRTIVYDFIILIN